MAVKVNFAKPGMGTDEGTIVRWLKAAGDRVEQGEIIVEIETAKAVLEVEAPASGILQDIAAPEGETIPVNSTLATIA